MTQSQLGAFLIASGCVATVLLVLYALANALACDPPEEEEEDDTDLYTPQSADDDMPLYVPSECCPSTSTGVWLRAKTAKTIEVKS